MEAPRLIDEQEECRAEYVENQPSIKDQHARVCELLDASSAFDGELASSRGSAQFGSIETTWCSHNADQCYEAKGTIVWRGPGDAGGEDSLQIRIARARLGMWLWMVRTMRETQEEQTPLLPSGVASTAKEAKFQSLQVAIRLLPKSGSARLDARRAMSELGRDDTPVSATPTEPFQDHRVIYHAALGRQHLKSYGYVTK